MKKPSLYLAFNKEGKQLGLFDTWENAQRKEGVTSAEFWDYNEKTGQYHPTGNKVCKFDILPTKEEYEAQQKSSKVIQK